MVYNLFFKSAFNVDTVNHREHLCNLLGIFQVVSVFQVCNETFFSLWRNEMVNQNKTFKNIIICGTDISSSKTKETTRCT